MHQRPAGAIDPDETPYDIVYETVAEVGDDGPEFVVLTAQNRVMRTHANDPEGLYIDWLEEDAGIDAQFYLLMGKAYWDLDERDVVTIERIEQKNSYDKAGNPMGKGEHFVVLDYDKAIFEGWHGERTNTRRLPMKRFEKLATGGSIHLDNYRFLAQRRFGNANDLPP